MAGKHTTDFPHRRLIIQGFLSVNAKPNLRLMVQHWRIQRATLLKIPLHMRLNKAVLFLSWVHNGWAAYGQMARYQDGMGRRAATYWLQ